jgi:hypothetical protein
MARNRTPEWLKPLLAGQATPAPPAATPPVTHKLRGRDFEIRGLPCDFVPRAGKLLHSAAVEQSIGSLDYYLLELPGPTIVELHVARPPAHRLKAPCFVRGCVRVPA